MPGLEADGDGVLILEGGEVQAAHASLNEVVNGLKSDPSFDRGPAEVLLRSATRAIGDGSDPSPVLPLAGPERRALHAALVRTLDELDPFELETRMGVAREAVEQLAAKVQV